MAGRWIHAVAGGDCEVDVCNGGGGGSGESWAQGVIVHVMSLIVPLLCIQVCLLSVPPIYHTLVTHCGMGRRQETCRR